MSSQEQPEDEHAEESPDAAGRAEGAEGAEDAEDADQEESKGDEPASGGDDEKPEDEPIAEVGERIDKARSQAEDAGVLPEEAEPEEDGPEETKPEDDEREFADSGATEPDDDQTIAPPG